MTNQIKPGTPEYLKTMADIETGQDQPEPHQRPRPRIEILSAAQIIARDDAERAVRIIAEIDAADTLEKLALLARKYKGDAAFDAAVLAIIKSHLN